MQKIFFIVIILFTFTNRSYAQNNENILTDKARWYKIYWSGIHIADLKIQMTDGEVKSVIESYGIVKKVSKFHNITNTKFDYVDGKYIPKIFSNTAKHRHGNRTIDVEYNNGLITKEAVNPPDKRFKRPAVDDKMKIGAFDPLSVALNAREQVKNGLKNGARKFSINMYDGRRLARLDFNIIGRTKKSILKTERDIVEVNFKRIPLAGFTDNELERMEGEEPLFVIYLSDDNYFLPIRVEADAPLGTAVFLFEKDCVSIKNCG